MLDCQDMKEHNDQNKGNRGPRPQGSGKRVFQSKDFGERNKRFRDKPDRTLPPKMDPLPAETPDEYQGFFSVGKNGIGFSTHKETGGVIMIEPQHSMHAFSRDTVRVRVLDRKAGTGEVIEIIKRSKVAYAGIVDERGGYLVLVPTDSREPEIRLKDAPADAKGKKVIAALDGFEGDIALGHISEILGDAGTNNAEMLALALEKGFSQEFPESVIVEAQTLHGAGITDEEISKRRDMRDILTFTIDPIDAKDFDDALSIQTLPDGRYEIGIHIADVSHYMRPGSALDEEARKRTTSVYLVDRVIPMLPEVLSNELCSLRADEDKCTFSTVFIIDPQTGRVDDVWYGRTIIRSNKRFTYEEAQEIITKGEGLYVTELTELNRISKLYTKERFQNGALSLDQDEVRFVLDEDGKPLRVMIKERIDTNRLIEEFMLLANKYVAIRLSQKNAAGVAVYRVHDKPTAERMEDLARFLKSLGYEIHMQNGVIPPHDLQKIIDSAETDDARDAISTAIVRTQAKAIYSTQNIGHYGLAFGFYTHFTSPIRRYPDVMVHRLLQMTLDGQKASMEEAGDFEYMSKYSSDRERDAQEAEWASIKYKQVEYMSERVGQEFVGIITGLGKYGAYVAEAQSKSEGMIRLMDLGDDFFAYEETRAAIVGRKTGEQFRVGDRIRIKVKAANLEKRVIDYVLVRDPEVQK